MRMAKINIYMDIGGTMDIRSARLSFIENVKTILVKLLQLAVGFVATVILKHLVSS